MKFIPSQSLENRKTQLDILCILYDRVNSLYDALYRFRSQRSYFITSVPED